MRSVGDVEFVERREYVNRVASLRRDGFETCSDLTAVDYLEFPPRELDGVFLPERFEVVVNLLSISQLRRLRLRVQVPESEPVLPTLFHIYPGTEAMEREVYDMYGIVFLDHPDLSRILMPEEWEGHPLRKDYATGNIPIQFKEVRSQR